MKKYKVKVTMPQQMNMGGYVPENIFAYGGQHGHSLDLGSKKVYDEMGQPDPYAVSKSKLQPVPREMANLEAERGETAYGDIDSDGMMELQEIGGKRHSEKNQYGEGGTPLNLKPGTFIYSDTKRMKLGGAELAPFGKSANSKKKYTPAALSKQYDIAKYKAIIEDPNADPIAKRTAQYMMNNNTFKLAQLALAQEAKKGFANGIPQVAYPALPREIQEQLQGQQEAESQEMPAEGSEYMREGGTNNSGFKALPDYVQHQILSNMAYGGYTTGVFAEGGEPNGEMAMGQMAAVADKMSKLLQFVNPEQNLDPWIASKLAIMDDSADSISNYMMYNPEAQGEEMEDEEMRNGGEMIRRADGSYSRRGMWDNIRANKGSGKKPSAEMLKQERKIRAQEKAEGGDVYNTSPAPYSNEYMDKLQSEYNRFYAGPTIPYEPYGKDDGFDGFYHHKIDPLMRMVKEQGWLIDKPSIPDFQKVFIKDDGINEQPMPTKKTTVKRVDDYYTKHTDDNDWSRITKYLQEQARVAPKNTAPFMKKGGEPQNAGFQALPEFVQQQIMTNMAYGGPFLEEYQTKGEVKAKTIKTKAELEKFIKQGYTQIPGTNQYRKENTNTVTKAPTITPGKAAIPGQDAVVQKGTPGKKYEPNENSWWRSLTPEQKAAHNAKVRKMIKTDPKYTGTPDKIVKEAVAAIPAVPETKVCEPGYTLNPNTGQCELIQKSEDILQYSQDTDGVIPGKFTPPGDLDMPRNMKPDDWAVNQAMLSMAGIPQMNPYMANPRMTQVKGVFMDPTRAYAANAEAAAQQLAAARTFANPRNFAAAASQVAGKQLEGNANIDTTINGQNVAIANQIEGMNAQYRDKYFGEKMKTDSLYNEQVNAVNKENFRNFDAASKQMLAARQNRFNNAMMMDMVNKNNQYYSVNPRTGETIMKAGKDPFTSSATGTGNQDYYTQLKGVADGLKSKFPGLSDDQLLKHAQDMMMGKQTTRYDGTGQMSGYNQILPYLAMMGRNPTGAGIPLQRYGGLVDAYSIFPF